MTEQEYAAYTAEEWIKGAAYYVRPCNERERRLLAEGYKQGVYDTMIKMRNEKDGGGKIG
jgi:hypothetical protein